MYIFNHIDEYILCILNKHVWKQEHLFVYWLIMKHTRVVSVKFIAGFACRVFTDTILVCFIVNEISVPAIETLFGLVVF